MMLMLSLMMVKMVTTVATVVVLMMVMMIMTTVMAIAHQHHPRGATSGKIDTNEDGDADYGDGNHSFIHAFIR